MSTRIRATVAGSWLFGKGKNDYSTNLYAVAQDIDYNLSMFLGDCFFATNAGIDWFNLLGGKNEIAVGLAINTAILNTSGVQGILQTNFTLNPTTRILNVQYTVQTVYSVLQSSFAYNLGLSGS